jgi:hypothetical protein
MDRRLRMHRDAHYGPGATAHLQEQVQEQNNCCAICGKPFTEAKYQGPHLDHDHRTKQLRGALCFSCNTALGRFGDRLDLIAKAFEYLYKWREKT